ncbi:hypothetical protein SGFS_031170 [Streptomyces graminofaciens]|uniref:HTH luxR-type domain-containing protein n=1 Tax=Streptomyces graminofaciens TaxID=68212 RepID=A0ABN5VEQ3_9ACTN|nr:LuxR family transcriptional regulator [Streptomyces graminofaciens]BBC31823.1 hypothetical protein SGFS_031170 [Streptomyces graminofaciens]
MTNVGHRATEAQRPRNTATVLASLHDLVLATRSGPAECALVRGGWGSGRSTVLRAVHERASEGGYEVLRTAGRLLPPLGAYGAIRAVASPLGLSLAHSSRQSRQSISNRVHQALADLTAAHPVALLVDDAHLCDEESLRCIDHVLRHGAELRLLVVLAHRPGDSGPGHPVLRTLATRWQRNVITLPPLTTDEVAETVGRALGEPPERDFAVRCAELSGGNPLVLQRVLDAARRHGLRPDTRGTRRLDTLAHEVLSVLALRKLAQHGERVHRVAQAVALLDSVGAVDIDSPEPTESELVSALARVPRAVTNDALDTLRQDELLSTTACGTRIRPNVRSRLLAALPVPELRDLRSRAARLLNEAGGPAEAVARLLPDSPDQLWMYDVLREATTRAARLGAQMAAVCFLDRLIAADLPTLDSDIRLRHRLELEYLLARTSPTTAARHLRAILQHSRDPQLLADAAIHFGALVADTAHMTEADGYLEKALRALAPEPAEPSVPASGALRTRVAYARLALALLEPQDAPQDPGEPRPALPPELPAAVALHLAERSGEARALLGRSFRTASAESDPRALILALSVRSLISHVVGDLAEAQDTARSALSTMARTPQAAGLLLPYIAHVQSLVGCGATGLAAGASQSAPATVPSGNDLWEMKRPLYEQYVLAAVPGRPAQPSQDPTDTRRVQRRQDTVLTSDRGNPVLTHWRLSVDQALLVLGNTPRADGRWHAARRAGLGLLTDTLTVTVDGERSVGELTETAHALTGGPGQRLASAWAVYRLGSALLRRGEIHAAREQLYRAYGLADQCGAQVLATMAQTELAAAGGPLRHSADALTPSERRVAELAAGGATNREIADRLFIASRTVESHLTSVYKKIPGGRAALRLSLVDTAGEPAPPHVPGAQERKER